MHHQQNAFNEKFANNKVLQNNDKMEERGWKNETCKHSTCTLQTVPRCVERVSEHGSIANKALNNAGPNFINMNMNASPAVIIEM